VSTLRLAAFQCALAGAGQSERLAALRAAIAGQGQRPDLVVCPELFMSGYNVGAAIDAQAEAPDGPFAARIAALARETGTAICYGYPERDGDKVYNAAACIGSDGAFIANHRKLVIPPGFELEHFACGARPTFFTLAGLRFAILICYDAEFPEGVRHAALAGAHCLLVPTALSDQWGVVALKMMPTRAFENGVYVVYCDHAGAEGDLTYAGGSCIASPVGADLARAGAGHEVIAADIDAATVAAAQARLPYLRDLAGLERALKAR
jgi:predicted amidohydrolase